MSLSNKSFLFVFFLGLSSLFFIKNINAATITSAQSGNWSDTATWSGGVVPGDGDVADIANNHTVVVDTNTTVGPSGTSTEMAVDLNATGVLVVATNTTFIVRGSVYFDPSSWGGSNTTTAVVVGPGSVWEFDSSAATTPTSTKYRFGGNNSNPWELRLFAVNGSSDNRATVRSNAGGANGYFSLHADNILGGNFKAQYADFLRIGDASQDGWHGGWISYIYDYVNWNVTHSTFDYCGGINYNYGVASEGTLVHSYNVHTNSVSSESIENLSASETKTTGTREIVGNIFDKIIGWAGFYLKDTVLTNNYFADGYNIHYETVWEKSDNNFLIKKGSGYLSALGDLTNSVLFGNADLGNPHWSSNSAYVTELHFDNNIIDFAGYNNDDGGDVFLSNNSNASNTIYLKNNIILPSARRQMGGSLLTLFGNCPNNLFRVEHNTVFLDKQGIVDFETGTPVAGSLDYLKSNIVWGDAVSTFFKIRDFTSGITTDVADPNNLDYNVGWNDDTTSQKGYQGTWSVEPPASNDLDANPSFVDDTRNVVTWDTAYLDNSATSWDSYASGDTFTTGTMVSNTDTNMYGSVVINYRAITTHTKNTVNSEPGVGSSWHTYWEFASLYRIREAIANQTTYNPDTANGLSSASTTIPTLMSWIRTGFSPTNLALKNTANTTTWDGLDLGAVSVSDIYAPTITIITPTASEEINSTYSLTASSTDWFDVVGVKFYYNTTTLIGSEVTSTSSPDVYSLSWDTTALSDGSYSLIAVARDSAGNQATSTAVSFTITNDSDAPTRSAGSPSGALASTVTSATISLTTDESATCKYSTTAGTAYGSMTAFSTTGGTSHSSNISVSSPNSYSYYVKCSDSFSNVNASDYTISFSVASAGGVSLPAQAYVPPAPPSGSSNFSASAQTISNVQTTEGVAAIFGQANVKITTNVGNDTVKMSISNNSDFKGAIIEPYQKEKDWNVCWKSSVLQYPSECKTGEYKVYIKFYTVWGQSSETLVVTMNNISKDSKTTETKSTVKNETTDTFIFSKDLIYGDNNSDVKELQKRLKEENLFDYPYFTNYFGSVTLKAVKAYQQKYGISPVNGTVGPQTRDILNNGKSIIQKEEVKNTENYIFNNDIEYGMINEEVRELQKRLAEEGVFDHAITNFFGPVTLQAVKDYQSKHNISPINGRVGPLTRSILNK